ncbi:lysylphosphatidylglycerol synthase domain-containing protein [Shinella curvata]|uniref:Lysylphosphatidylglycerol synthase domain-containing protein n=1 Tax=Shinella curvata TaxID=1817964 RepID=A0ABT8XN14_9HYPH|nr:lysylphosphatidylglycerol synthase domain-containing protein [Shinella curvata]MCJ8056168.1 lysylphosphatidylglycerol synthase domain-containing protein [Shinella curvata]MDO6125129.1 lysylphosphatidylglycerol synthase domain-containing protein [Shinella curvata]
MKRAHFLHALIACAVLVAGWLIYRTLAQYSWDDIRDSLAAIPKGHFALALAFAACSYFCLTIFDFLALRYVGKPLSYPRAALASFTSLAIGHNVGVAALSSGAVRYRFYSRWGLDAEEIAKLIVFCGMTVGLGLITLAGLCLILLPGTAGKIAGLGTATSAVLGVACLAVGAVYMALSAFLRGELKVRSWRFALPPLRLAALQILVGTINFAFVAACLHQLLNGDVGYMETTAAYVVGNLTALVSHVPGGLGVLEATIGFLLGGSASIGALIAFRVVYFFIPLPLGVVSLLASEALLGSNADAGLHKGAS